MPAYNEEANIEAVLEETRDFLKNAGVDFEIVVVNDGSRDRTAEMLKSWQKKCPQLVVISHARNKGYGAAVSKGLQAARGDLIFFTDSDRQFDIRELIIFLDQIPRYDFVVGYRRVRHDPLGRVMLANVFRLLSRLLFSIKVRDVNCAFKLFQARVIQSMRLTQPGALINLEIFALAQKLGYRFIELPVTHRPRLKGKQTGGSLRVVFKAFTDLFRLYREIEKQTSV